MALGFGVNMRLGMAEETTYGTGVTTATHFLELMEESFQAEQFKTERKSLRSNSQRLGLNGKMDVKGSFKFEFPLQNAEKILKHAMGTCAAVSGANPYTHAFTLASALPVGLTVQVDRDDGNITGSAVYSYEGCKISKLTLTQESGEYLMASVDVIGEDLAMLASPTTFAPAAFSGLDWSQLTTFTANGVSLLGKIEGFELSIENPFADRYQLGTDTRKEPVRSGPRKITGKISMEYDALTQYNLYSAQTSFAIAATWTNGSHSMAISLPVCTAQGTEPTTKDAGPYKLEIPFTAWRSAADNDEMTLTLINGNSASQA